MSGQLFNETHTTITVHPLNAVAEHFQDGARLAGRKAVDHFTALVEDFEGAVNRELERRPAELTADFEARVAAEVERRLLALHDSPVAPAPAERAVSAPEMTGAVVAAQDMQVCHSCTGVVHVPGSGAIFSSFPQQFTHHPCIAAEHWQMEVALRGVDATEQEFVEAAVDFFHTYTDDRNKLLGIAQAVWNYQLPLTTVAKAVWLVESAEELQPFLERELEARRRKTRTVLRPARNR